ncbi:MAG: FUSC family protein [Pseudolabrys sp.]
MSDADWEALREVPDREAMGLIARLSRAIADDVDAMALRLISAGGAMPACLHPDLLAALDAALARLADAGREDAVAGLHPTRLKLARAMQRTRHLAEVLSAPDDGAPPLPAAALAAFVQPPVQWIATLRPHMTLTSPVTRYAVRLTLAMLAGYAVTVALPNLVHGGWILLTVALIMRASYAITRQRRNDRLLGTLAGCALAAVLIPVLPPHAVVAIIIVGVGVAHAYAAVNYRITSFAASLMALLLLHFLEPQTFYVADRVIDTVIGAVLSVVFARVLPSWEWNDVPRLVTALLTADRAFADRALTADADDHRYRLARKQALDRFTALATIARRLSSEPHHDDRQFVGLSELLAANYLFASDLASVQGMLRVRAGASDAQAITLLDETRARVLASLAATDAAPPPETLRRRGWFELRDVEPLTLLRRRLLHIEHGAQRLAAQAGRAVAKRSAPPR